MNTFDDMQEGRRLLLQDKYEFLRPTLLTEGLMAFAFDCDDGWLSILEDLFVEIDEEVKRSALTSFKVVQVKETFGILVVYVVGGNDTINELIAAALEKINV